MYAWMGLGVPCEDLRCETQSLPQEPTVWPEHTGLIMTEEAMLKS